MKITTAARRKVRSLLEQARVARAMQRAAYDRHSELQVELVDATREVHRLQSSDERRRWSNPNRAIGSAAPGARTYEDVLSKAQRRLERRQKQAHDARRNQDEATKAATALVRPLERIAEQLKLEQIAGGAADPLRNLDDFVAGAVMDAGAPLGVYLLREDSKDARPLLKIRAALHANRNAREALGAARLSDAEIKARVNADLDHFCRYGGDSLGAVAFTGGGVGPQPDPISDALENPRAVATLLREVLEPALVARIIAEAGDADALSEAERRKQTTSLAADRRKIELAEEREVLRLEREGFSVARRTDVDVELLFEVWNAELPADEAAA